MTSSLTRVSFILSPHYFGVSIAHAKVWESNTMRVIKHPLWVCTNTSLTDEQDADERQYDVQDLFRGAATEGGNGLFVSLAIFPLQINLWLQNLNVFFFSQRRLIIESSEAEEEKKIPKAQALKDNSITISKKKKNTQCLFPPWLHTMFLSPFLCGKGIVWKDALPEQILLSVMFPERA